jgi:hypothetical protein
VKWRVGKRTEAEYRFCKPRDGPGGSQRVIGPFIKFTGTIPDFVMM